LSILLIFLFVVTGCDNISSVKKYFSGPDGQKTAGTEGMAQPAAKGKNAKSASVPKKGDILARVGDWSISVKEFDERLSALKEIIPEYDTNDIEARRLVLDELVNQQIMVFGAERSGLAQQSDIKAAVEEFRRTLIVREVARQLTENIAVTDQEARAFYEENKDALIGPEQWRVREIVVPTKEEATGILGQLIGGADFAATARLQSKGKTAANGGDLGFITEEPFAQMGNALLSLEVGDTSGVFKGPDGYYIVKLEEKKGGELISFDEIKEDIKQSQTLIKQQEAILDHLERLKAQSNININEGLL